MEVNDENKIQNLEEYLRAVKKETLEEYFGYPISDEEAMRMELPDEILEHLGDL